MLNPSWDRTCPALISGKSPCDLKPRQSTTLNMRIPAALLDAVRAKAKAKGIPYTGYMRMLLEADLQRQ